VTITIGWARDDGAGTLEDLAGAADRAMLARKGARLTTTS
jgi:hypothetical protein